MNYARILSALDEPTLITPGYNASLRRLFSEHIALSRGEFRASREGTDSSGGKIEIPQAEIRDGINFVPIGGPIGRGLGSFEKGAGCVDVADIEAELRTGEADPTVRAHIGIFDTPGGMYSGTPELSDFIQTLTKPKLAWIPGMACSAGAWLAASFDASFASKTADLGCIGVYCYLLDQTAAMEQEGLKADLVTSGKYKGMGAPGIPLTDEQRAHLQDRVDEMAQTFYEHMSANRPAVAREDMQGQVFKAPTALQKGFIDGIVRNLDDVVALLS